MNSSAETRAINDSDRFSAFDDRHLFELANSMLDEAAVKLGPESKFSVI